MNEVKSLFVHLCVYFKQICLFLNNQNLRSAVCLYIWLRTSSGFYLHLLSTTFHILAFYFYRINSFLIFLPLQHFVLICHKISIKYEVCVWNCDPVSKWIRHDLRQAVDEFRYKQLSWKQVSYKSADLVTYCYFNVKLSHKLTLVLTVLIIHLTFKSFSPSFLLKADKFRFLH